MSRDSLDPELVLRRQARRNRMVAVAIGAVPVLATCFFCTYPIAREVIGDRFDERFPLSEAQVAQAQAAIERARAAARENDEAFVAALATVEELAPREDLGGGCPHRLPLPERHAHQPSVLLFAPFTVHEVAPGQASSITGTASVASVESIAAEVERGIAEPSTSSERPRIVVEQAEDAVHAIRPEVVLIVRERRRGYGTAGAGLDTFESGFVRGTAYLWSPSSRRFACAAEIFAENGESVDYTSYGYGVGTTDQASLDGALEQDLQVELWTAIAQGLVSAGPRPSESEALEILEQLGVGAR